MGRRASEYVLREFEPLPHKVLECGETPDAEQIGDFKYICYFPLDMPLLCAASVRRAIDTMWRRGISYLNTGSGHISRGGAQFPMGFSLNDDSFLALSDAKSYELVYNQLRKQIIERAIDAGAEIIDASTVHIDDTVKIEEGAVIRPFSVVCGASEIRQGAKIYASDIIDSKVDRGAEVLRSYVTDSEIGENATVGPFARLRGAKIGANARIGDFVEVKASTVGEGTKAAHLTYIGDAEVGAKTNIGCGTVFCNYDGKHKHKTTVGEGCFIGANTNLVAPLNLGDGVFVAAGTTVTRDVESQKFVIGRMRQEVKEKKTAESCDLKTAPPSE